MKSYRGRAGGMHIDKVKSFVNDITKFDYDFDLVSGRYVIDAKSIMGIFSLDLSKPIDLNIHAEDAIGWKSWIFLRRSIPMRLRSSPLRTAVLSLWPSIR